MDLLCIGDVMVDVHAATGTLATGADVHGRVVIRPGGTSANAAVWAAHDGASVGVAGMVGRDLPGELCVRALERVGVDVTAIRTASEPTGAMLIMFDAHERSMAADRGANASLTVADLPAFTGVATTLISGYLLLQEPTTEVARAALAAARATGCAVAAEAASWSLLEAFGPERFLDETADADLIFANEDEARTLTGLEADRAVRSLGERYRVAVVKRGERGALLVHDGTALEAPAEEIDEVDPTGAGDAFDGVLLGRLARGLDPRDALAAACHAGALVASSRETWPRGPVG